MESKWVSGQSRSRQWTVHTHSYKHTCSYLHSTNLPFFPPQPTTSKMERVKVNPSCLLFRVLLTFSILFTATRVTADQGLSRDCMLNEVKRNPKNEHTFYWCLADGPVLMKCVNQLVFNSHAKKCISPMEHEKRRGKRGSNLTRQKTEGISSSSSSKGADSSNKSSYLTPFFSLSSKYIPPQGPSTTQAQQQGGIFSTVYCPIAEYGRDAPLVLIPSPEYCDTFFMCDNGLPVLFLCPANTDFNPKLRVCDTMANVKCTLGKRRRDVVVAPSPAPRTPPATADIVEEWKAEEESKDQSSPDNPLLQLE